MISSPGHDLKPDLRSTGRAANGNRYHQGPAQLRRVIVLSFRRRSCCRHSCCSIPPHTASPRITHVQTPVLVGQLAFPSRTVCVYRYQHTKRTKTFTTTSLHRLLIISGPDFRNICSPCCKT